MQRVEFYDLGQPLHCPFCGHKTIKTRGTSPCEHTLYNATDEVLVYCSERIKKRALLNQANKLGWDEATDKLDYPESVKFALYNPPPSFYGKYFGYAAAPTE